MQYNFSSQMSKQNKYHSEVFYNLFSESMYFTSDVRIVRTLFLLTFFTFIILTMVP